MFPDFFAAAPVIRMHDPLADFLGAAVDGVIDYRYEDAVRLAGHSCPTVASAFLMVRAGLGALYGEALPVRGELRVELAEAEEGGVSGVVAAVAGLLTGAAGNGGFHGLAGRFSRRERLFFGRSTVTGTLRLTRLDNRQAVTVSADLRPVPADPMLGQLLSLCLNGRANEAERRLFQSLWQERVRRLLLEHADDPQVIRVILES